MIRLSGGILYLAGMLIMAYNVARTVAGGVLVSPPVPQPQLAHA